MKIFSLPPGRYLVGDPESLVSPEVCEMAREIFESNNPDGKYVSSRVVYDEHVMALIPIPQKQVWYDNAWNIKAESGMIAVMPVELVTADVATLTKAVTGAQTRYKSVGAIETATSKFLIMEIGTDHFVVGEEVFELMSPPEE